MVPIGAGPQEARHRAGAEVLRRHGADRPLDLELAGMAGQIDRLLEQGPGRTSR